MKSIRSVRFISIYSLVALIAAAAFAALSPNQSALAGAPAKSACGTVTLEVPHSDACNAEIDTMPTPDLVRPVKLDEAKQGASVPRSVLLPKEGTAYPIGWIIKTWYYSDAPGVQPPAFTKDRIINKRTLVYLYATVKVKNVEWFMIGKDRWMSSEQIAALKIPLRPAKVKGQWITLDLTEQTLIAMVDDTPVFATLISASWDGYGFTREGLFNIYARTRSTIFRGPPWAVVPEYIYNHVPDVMFFDKHIALHGAYWHDWFGFPRTHGCVNIPVGDEAWLWDWVSQSEASWGSGDDQFHIAHPENAPFVYVYRSDKPGLTR